MATKLTTRITVKALLAAAGVAALLAAPASAKTRTYAYEHAPYSINEGGPYTPSMQQPAHDQIRDFQDGSR